MSSATLIKLRAKMDARAAEAAQFEAQMAQAAAREETRLARELEDQASAAAPDQGSERLHPDLVNPFETPGGVDASTYR